jgi:glycine dehydrogenase
MFEQKTGGSETAPLSGLPAATDRFLNRHLGPTPAEQKEMLQSLGLSSLEELVDAAVPASIRLSRELHLPEPLGEREALAELREIASRNRAMRSFIGMGYAEAVTPPVIQRNILENPGWYTPYTPYQAEIAQGRLEGLLNFQTMVTDLTGLDIANASLLDEATAAAEAMTLCFAAREGRTRFLVSELCHPQTIAVVQTRARPLGIDIVVGNHEAFMFSDQLAGVLVQYPATDGVIHDYQALAEASHQAGALLVVAADLFSLVLLRPPGEFGADVAVGSAQRFGVPMGYGGPHAAFFATKDAFKRQMPGRLVGVSKDSHGRPALRLTLQTREQHIRREKATSNICTAQALLANMASMYAVYHGPDGLRQIALRIRKFTLALAEGLRWLGFAAGCEPLFDTLKIGLTEGTDMDSVMVAARAARRSMNFRVWDEKTIGITLDEAVTERELTAILEVFNHDRPLPFTLEDIVFSRPWHDLKQFARASRFLEHPVFNQHHSETKMLRYIRRLEAKDISLTTSMVPLGSCTMKLNATSEMIPVSWPEFSKPHPFAPRSGTEGYQLLFKQLETWLAEITGFPAVSLQPNAGSQGEYAGLLAIRDYHLSRREGRRHVCLIPQSAHGTNPASAVMAGMEVVPVACDASGNINLDDLRAKALLHREKLAALMVTYPSTHGVFEETIREVCRIIHENGGQVYRDGANMNAQVGLCAPGDMGADVCHLNLHKTFCIPHGGGGPGVGPIGVAAHLVPFLPGRRPPGAEKSGDVTLDEYRPHLPGVGAVAAAPWGSASILVVSWVYIRLMGVRGLTEATAVAILNANYVARRLAAKFPTLFQGRGGFVAHECILDLRKYKSVTVEDVAKRLMDFGFHAPTISWPVPGTMMVEPTESESKDELDRFCDAMLRIHDEIEAVESGRMSKQNNPLKNAPHTAEAVVGEVWDRPYSREQAAYPAPWVRWAKFWPAVGRVDNVFGDRNLVCSCVGMEAYESE